MQALTYKYLRQNQRNYKETNVKKQIIHCAMLFLLSTSTSMAVNIQSIGIMGGTPDIPVGDQGEVFYRANFPFYYAGGTVMLSANQDGSGDTAVDDVLIITVVHPDKTISRFSKDYSKGCSWGIQPLPPTDISSKFASGLNKVYVTLKDKCGEGAGSSSLWLNNLTP